MSLRHYIFGAFNFCETKLHEIKSGLAGEVESKVVFTEQLNLEEISAFLNTQPLFVDNKLLCIKGFENIKKEDYQNLTTIFNQQSSSVSIVLVRLVESSRREVKKPLINEKQLEKDGFKLIIQMKQNKNDACKSLQRELSEKFCKIDYHQTMSIYEMYNENLDMIKKEIEKLELFYIKTKPQDSLELISCFSFYQSNDVFNLLDSFALLNKRRAFYFLDRIYMSEKVYLPLIFQMFNSIKNIDIYKTDKEKLKIHPFVLQKVAKNSIIWSDKMLGNFFDSTQKLDFMFKTGQINDKNYIALLIGNLPFNKAIN